MRWHLVPLAAFLVQADPPALALGVVVFDAHGDDGADPGEREGHHGYQRPIAQPDDAGCFLHRPIRQRDPAGDPDAVQQLARLFGVQHRCLAGFDDMLRAAHRVRRIGGDNLAGDQPVEQHADGGEVLLHGWFLEAGLHRFDIGRDMQRLDVGELADPMLVAPVEESARCSRSRPRHRCDHHRPNHSECFRRTGKEATAAAPHDPEETAPPDDPSAQQTDASADHMCEGVRRRAMLLSGLADATGRCAVKMML